MRQTKYRRVADELRAECAELPVGTQLPSEKDLAARMGVSTMTVRQALELLADEGIVTRVVGRGTFVQRQVVAKGDVLSSFSADMRSRGLKPSTRLLGVELVPVPARVARDLYLGAREKVLQLERLHFADDIPMCVELAHVPARLADRLVSEDLEGSLPALLDRIGIRLTTGVRHIRAVAVAGRHATLLGVPDTSPALQIVQVFSDTMRRPIQRSESLYRADRYEAYSRIHREPPGDD